MIINISVTDRDRSANKDAGDSLSVVTEGDMSEIRRAQLIVREIKGRKAAQGERVQSYVRGGLEYDIGGEELMWEWDPGGMVVTRERQYQLVLLVG